MTPEQRKIVDHIWPTFMHVPYVWGGSCPNVGLDCSGLVVELLKTLDVLPANYDSTAQGLYRRFTKDVIPDRVEYGDLVFYGATENTITHVGFCLSNRLMLEAGGGMRTMTDRATGIKLGGRVRVRPIDNRSDLVGFRRPEYVF